MDFPRSDVADGLRLLWQLPRFLWRPPTSAEAVAQFRSQIAQREAQFLSFVRHAIYNHRRSPYRALLGHAGCEYQDCVRLVRQEGVEGALTTLSAQGVYLTVDEFKRRQPIERGSLRLEFEHADLFNVLTRPALAAWTGGSRRAVEVPIDLAFLRYRVMIDQVDYWASDARPVAAAIWRAPGSSSISHFLRLHALGMSHVAWFSQVDPERGLPARYRRSVRFMRWAGLPLGLAVPRPLYAPIDAPEPVLDWVLEMRKSGTVHVRSLVSGAVALARTAEAHGISLDGVYLHATGEPLTPAGWATIKASGAGLLTDYGSMEIGCVAIGCRNPMAPDDVHLLHHSGAAIEAPTAAGLPGNAILLSSFLNVAPLVLFNTSVGDSATIDRRTCGCALDGLGLPIHLSNIRSYEKVTSSGWKALDVDLIQILEEVLPARCGGGPRDYQLVESPGDDGSSGIWLLVSPAVGPVDLVAVRSTFLEAVRAVAPAQQMTSAIWEASGWPVVEQRAHYVGGNGKVLHLHVSTQQPGDR